LLLLIILWKEEQLDAENNQEEMLGLEKFLFKRALYRKGRFSEVAPPKFFRLSIGNEVRRMDILLRRISYKIVTVQLLKYKLPMKIVGGSGSLSA
jgi:hypothetical protein